MSRTLQVVEAVNRLSRSRFEWGRTDCCQFVLQVVNAYSAQQFEWPRTYSSKLEAEAILEEYGGLRALVSRYLKTEDCKPTEARDGDPLLLHARGMELLGVRLHDLAVYKTIHGVSAGDIHAAGVICAWRID